MSIKQQLIDVITQIGADIKALKSGRGKQDTGWYNITSVVKVPDGVNQTGKIYCRRIDNQVYIAFENFRWDKATSQAQFFPADLCAYTHPTWDNTWRAKIRLRWGGLIPADNRNAVAFIYDWLGPSMFRLASQPQLFATYATISWITDTPFPDDNKLIGEKVEYQ